MAMKQQCHLWNVWLTWLALPAVALLVGLLQSWWAAGLVLLIGVLAQVLYIRFFPRLSRFLGYGSVGDVEAGTAQPVESLDRHVTLYTANVCPFCPIVRRRLQQLQQELGFELEEIDVTFQPQIVRAKGFRSVPVVECDGRYWVGNATTAELSAFLADPQGTAAAEPA